MKFENDETLKRRILFLYDEWQKTYPEISVLSQIRWAHVWLLENPKKDKKNYVRYLGNWMRSAERRRLEAGGQKVVHKPYVEQRPKEDDLMTLEDIQRMKEAIRK